MILYNSGVGSNVGSFMHLLLDSSHGLLSTGYSLNGFHQLSHLCTNLGHLFSQRSLVLLELIHDCSLIIASVVWMWRSQLDVADSVKKGR